MLRRMLQLQSYDSVDLVLLVPSAKLEGSPIAVRIPIRMLGPQINDGKQFSRCPAFCLQV